MKKTLFWLENSISMHRGNTMKLLYAEVQLSSLQWIFQPEMDQDSKDKLIQTIKASFRLMKIRVDESGLLFISRWYLLREIDKLAQQTLKEIR